MIKMTDIQKMLNNAILALTASVSMASCQMDEIADPSLLSGQDKASGVSLTFSADTVAVKTSWNGSSIIWSAGDRISVGYSVDGLWSDSLFESESLAESSSRAAYVVRTDLEGTETGAMNFYGVYPSSAVSSDFAQAPVLTVTVPSAQTASASSYDSSADIMVARSYYEYDSVPDSSIPMLWRRLVAHADITLSNIPLAEGESIKSVILTADEQALMTGDFQIDVRTGGYEKTSLSEQSNSVAIDVSALSADESGNLNLWAAFMPCRWESFEVALMTTHRIYTRSITSCELEFAANRRNVIEIDMSSATFAEIDPEIFGLLNLDYPGLEKVKAECQRGSYYAASECLVDYFRNRTSVVNPEVDLPATRMYNEDKRIAAQALEHRFCVRRGYWYESVNGTEYTYWDFDDADGNINWDFHVEEAGQEFYQKHWHSWFKFLAWSQYLTGDDKYFDSWREVYSDWLSTYPCPGPDGNHNTYGNRSWHQLSVATRISNQLDLFPYFITSGHFTADWMCFFLVEFHKAVEFCRAHPYYEETSNIRFAQQTAEAQAAMLFPEFRNAATWLSDVAPQISSQFSLQFYPDGVHTEMAPNYQLGVMDNFRAIYNVARANGRLSEFDAEYTQKMRNAAIFLANYVWPDYTWEWFNDTFQQTRNVLLNNIKRYSALFPDENLLTYLASERKSGTVPTESLIPFPVGGYYVLRTGWDGQETMFILKNNYNPENEWHCHLDNGTFSLWSKGRVFLPDPGVYTYGGSTELDAIRTEMLATASHNTLTKNLESIAKNYSKGECLLTRTSASEDLVVTQNASYSDLTHRRAVYMLDKKFFVIVDEAFGTAAGVDVNVSFHLCEGTVKTDDYSQSYAYGVHTEFSDGNDMLLRTFAETTAGFVGQTGLSKCSPKVNEYYDRTFYRVTADKTSASDVARFITVIYPGRSADISASFSSSFSEGSSSVAVTIDGMTYNLAYSL